MKQKLHAMAGVAGFLIILTFWVSTLYSEIFGSVDTIIAVKGMIVWGMLLLIPAMGAAGGSGMAIGRKRKEPPARAKMRRMPIIALNGLIVLVPSALVLNAWAQAGSFDTAFYAVQMLELAAGALNLVLIGLNIRDGLAMARGRRVVAG